MRAISAAHDGKLGRFNSALYRTIEISFLFKQVVIFAKLFTVAIGNVILMLN